MLVIILKTVMFLFVLLCCLSISTGIMRHDYFFISIGILIALAFWIIKLQVHKLQNDPFA